MKRSAPLKRTRMQKRKRRARPGKDDARYLAWVRRRPCCSCGKAPPSHAHHVTGAGVGQKANDRDTLPLCARCHADLHEFAGRFFTWSRDYRAAWQRERVAEMQERYRRTEAA